MTLNNELRLRIYGDIHCKPRIIKDAREHLKDYDKIVFLGDYVDDWTATPEQSYQTLKELVDLKLENPDKVILCIGNHCLSECFAGEFKCSGFNDLTHSLVKDLYKTRGEGNEPIFQVAYAKGGVLFSHAGITNNFWKDTQLLIKNHYPDLQDLLEMDCDLAIKISNILNYAFLKGLENPEDKLFLTLSQAGASRGGWGTPSPVWADKTDLEANSVPNLTQVIGHTPVKTVTEHIVKNGDGSSHKLFFCDTFSTYYMPYIDATIPYGDESILEIILTNTRFKTNTIGGKYDERGDSPLH